MKKIIFLLLSVICLETSAQDTYVQTDVCSNARFEIIQSSIAAKATYMIDKYFGFTFCAVENPLDSTMNWEIIESEPHPDDKTENLGKVNYQLFISSISLKFTYLININTGATWELCRNTDTGKLFWRPFAKLDYSSKD